MKNRITLEEFHSLLADAYAVVANDTLYFVGYDDEDTPYIADNNGDEHVSFRKLDGPVVIYGNTLFFYVDGEPFKLRLLVVQNLKDL